MKKYIIIHCGNGYCGCDLDDALVFDEDITDEEISEIVWDLACENAETFAYVHFGWEEEYSDEEYEEYLSDYVTIDYSEVTYAEYVEFCENNNITSEEEE